MKRALIIFLSMVLIFTLAACGEKGEEGSQVQGSASTEASNTSSEIKQVKEG
jgi:uncharacterized lipoprotein YehR (DUF1307 family)